MTSRRTFVQSAVAVAALGASRLTTAAGIGTRAPRRRPGVVLFTTESVAGVSFAAAATRSGARVLGFGDDVGGLWLRELEPRLKSGPFALAGLTAGATLFCLEYLARDYGLRTVYRIEHVRLEDGDYRHTVTGPAGTERWAQSLADAGDAWGGTAALLAARCPLDLRSDASLPLPDLAHSGRSTASFTWLMAPAVSSA